jgi:tetratricopeptide (TPR) repeat protein
MDATICSRVRALPRLFRGRHEVVVSIALVAAVFITFGRVCRNDFINYDDDIYVTSCAGVQSGFSAAGMTWAWTSMQGFWHPLTWLSLQLDYTLYGAHPAGYHFTNLLLHAASCVLLFGILRRSTGDLRASAFAAAFFALHPLRVESVAWIAERKGVLSTFFALLAVAAYVRYTGRPGWARYLSVVVALLLGLLAKPMLVTLPAALFLLDYWPLGRTRWLPAANAQGGGPHLPVRWLIVEKLPLLALAVAASWIAVAAERHVGAIGVQPPLVDRCGDATIAYVRYLAMTVYPAGLTAFYPRHPGSAPVAQVFGAATVLVCFCLVAMGMARRRPAFAVGWAWFVGTLVPVIGLVQIGSHSIADRYTYLPHIGLAVCLAWGLPSQILRAATPRLLAPAALLILGGLSASSRSQVDTWRDSETVWRHGLVVTGDNFMAHSNLGAFLMGKGRYDEALEHMKAALSILPNIPQAHTNLGLLFIERGQLDAAREQLTIAAELKPEDAPSRSRLGDVLWKQGRADEAVMTFAEAVRLAPDEAMLRNRLGVAFLALSRPVEAEAAFAEANRLLPRSPFILANLGAALYNRGRVAEALNYLEQAVAVDSEYSAGHEKLAMALLWLGRLEEATTQYTQALRLEPREARLHDGLGTVEQARGRLIEAVASYRTALQLAPGVVKYHRDLAGALWDQGHRDEAENEYSHASRLDPGWPYAVDGAARALATDPDPARRCPILAVQMARQACQGARDHVEFRETLADAYRAAGRPNEANAATQDVAAAGR